jgi:hypothetical protein
VPRVAGHSQPVRSTPRPGCASRGALSPSGGPPPALLSLSPRRPARSLWRSTARIAPRRRRGEPPVRVRVPADTPARPALGVAVRPGGAGREEAPGARPGWAKDRARHARSQVRDGGRSPGVQGGDRRGSGAGELSASIAAVALKACEHAAAEGRLAKGEKPARPPVLVEPWRRAEKPA